MSRGKTVASALIVLALFVSSAFCFTAAAQDVTKPVITDLTAGEPVTGGAFVIQAMVTDDTGVSTVHVYPYFIVPSGYVTLMGTLMTQQPNNLYEAWLDVPANATELKYSFIAKDFSLNAQSTDVISVPVRDNVPPTAICPLSVSAETGSAVTLDGSASTDNVNVTGYAWSFNHAGSPTALLGATPSFTFTVPGEYACTLTVSDAWDNTGSQVFTVTVTDATPPEADAGIDAFTVAPNTVVFDGSASDDDVGITNYSWTFTYNGTAVTLYGVSPSYRFWTPGVYEVTLTVRDAGGNSDTAYMVVQALEPEGGGGISWWVYALVLMVALVVVAAIVIIKI